MLVENFIDSSVLFVGGCVVIKVLVSAVGNIVFLVFEKYVEKWDTFVDEFSAS